MIAFVIVCIESFNVVDGTVNVHFMKIVEYVIFGRALNNWNVLLYSRKKIVYGKMFESIYITQALKLYLAIAFECFFLLLFSSSCHLVISTTFCENCLISKKINHMFKSGVNELLVIIANTKIVSHCKYSI